MLLAWKLLAAALSGVAIHVLYFQRYEYHRRLYLIIGTGFAATIWIPLHLWTSGFTLQDSIVTAWSLQGTFVAAALLSTLIYRLLLSPLNRFPGPFAARLTDFWLAFHVGKKLNGYRKLERLHKCV